MYVPSFIYLYDGGRTESLNLGEIATYLKRKFIKIEVEVREDFIPFALTKLPAGKKSEVLETIAEEIASSRVHDIKNKECTFKPSPAEVNYEKRRLEDEKHKATGIIYDGFSLLSVFSGLIPKRESNLKYCHIIFTNQLFGTWDESDLRYHARVAVFGFPSIISTTGVVEAPAKPREFYIKRQIGVDLFTLKEEFKGRFIDYDDPQLTEVMKGYVAQAVFYHITGDPFCEDKDCRLYNAHWQEEVIKSQLRSKKELCLRHQKVIDQIASLNDTLTVPGS